MQRIVQKIEDRCGRAIGVKPMPQHVHRALGAAPAAMEIDTDGQQPRADLMLAEQVQLPAHMLAHEVLHAKHSILDGAPWIHPKDGSPSLVATAINNDAAHIEIIPVEISMFPEAAVFWSDHQHAGLIGFVDRIGRDPDRRAVRNDLLRFDLVTRHILPDWPHYDRLRQQVASLNLSADADHLQRAYEIASGRREHVLSALVRFHRLKPDDYLAVYALAPPARLPRHGD